jgi:hypothetical protein
VAAEDETTTLVRKDKGIPDNVEIDA